jgi:protein-S-isoprenylcysteine O-methyltransferase Ste14
VPALVRTLIFTIFVPGFWTILVPYWLAPRGTRLNFSGASAAGWVLIATGAAVYLMCAFWGFALRGGGTPAPMDPPKKLVIEGPYRVVRNPMYWSVLFVILGEAVVFHLVALAELGVGFFAFTMLFVLLYEEPTLRHKFGAEYEEYCRRVPRWIPRLFS